MIQKYTVTAEGEGRLDIVSRISMLFLQRHIDVESLSYMPVEGMVSRYQVCALANEDTIIKVVAQMRHIEGLTEITFE
jgi:glycine cleavage system regulatory protein